MLRGIFSFLRFISLICFPPDLYSGLVNCILYKNSVVQNHMTLKFKLDCHKFSLQLDIFTPLKFLDNKGVNISSCLLNYGNLAQI